MRNSETGEFELVVGNRQLLSGFFIVILLLAVTFAMGYVVGQNSPRSARSQADAGGTALVASGAADSRQQPSPAGPVVAPPPAAAAPPDQASADGTAPPPSENPLATQPAAAGSAPPAAAAPGANAAAPAPAAAGPVTDLPPGSYWQVMALGNHVDAEVVVRTLKDMGMPALTSPGPNNLMRVLVGPYSDTESMGRAKSKLENEGFHPQPLKK